MTGQATNQRGRIAATPTKTWHCGTLVYTKAGIVALFTFLLCGSFSFNVMITVVPSILPLKLKDLGASNTTMGLLLTSVFPIFGMFISPYLSFKSDYLRTRWGRRIPFFVGTLPLVTLSILLLAFSEDIAGFIRRTGLLSMLSPADAAIAVMGTCIVAFQFSNVLVCSTYIYIFNDTVPVALMGRFVGLMQVVGGGLGFLYNFFIFQYAESRMKEIFIGTALVYLIGIGLLCLFVKEGKYPPVTEEEKEKTRGLAGLKTFFRECFSHKFYWTKFIYAMTPALSGAAMAPFMIFFYRNMGLTLDYVGKAAAVTAVAGIAAAYLSSVFIDRWHPIRIITYSAVYAGCLSIGGWVWLFASIPPEAFFWFNMLGNGLIGIFGGALISLSTMPFDMRLQPKSRYGQFCSAQSIIGNGCTFAAGLIGGMYFDFWKWIFHGSDYAYRLNFIWTTVVNVFAAFVICSLYRQWKALGGDLHFHPPAPWSKTGFEEMEQAPFVGVQSRWLMHALRAVHLMMLITVVFMASLAYWLWHIGWSFDFGIYGLAVVPISIVLYMVWIKVERSIKADVRRCAAGEPMRNGIPYHGVFFVKASAMFVGLGITPGTTIVCLRHGLTNAVLVFGLNGVLSNALVIVAVLVFCRLERGYDPMLDFDGRKIIPT